MNAALNKCVLTLRLKISMLEESRILAGRLFQTATAECLKPRVARTVSATLTVNKCFEEDRRVRTG